MRCNQAPIPGRESVCFRVSKGCLALQTQIPRQLDRQDKVVRREL